MQSWLRISILLCCYGLLREMRPSESFVFEYLTSDSFNLTSDQVNKEIFPLGTYAVLAQLVVVFLVTDLLRYKAIIVLSSSAGIVVFALLLWSKTIWQLQIGQLFYGTFMASEVAYYTYIYAKVDKSHYQIVTGHTHAAILCGKFTGGVLAQIFVSTGVMSYRGLHMFSFVSIIISLFIALSLPKASRSLYFYAQTPSVAATDAADNQMSTLSVESENDPTLSWNNAANLLLQHAKGAYTNPIIREWSLWWALSTCGQLQAITYVQSLWKQIGSNHFYNGAVEATVAIMGAASAMTASRMSRNCRSRYMMMLTICPILMGSCLIASAVANEVWIAYVAYILFGIMHFFVITIASATIAENLVADSFGLIFGINTLVAMALHSMLTLVVVTDSGGFGLDPRNQFIVYGGYFLFLGGLYFIVMLTKLLHAIVA